MRSGSGGLCPPKQRLEIISMKNSRQLFCKPANLTLVLDRLCTKRRYKNICGTKSLHHVPELLHFLVGTNDKFSHIFKC